MVVGNRLLTSSICAVILLEVGVAGQGEADKDLVSGDGFEGGSIVVKWGFESCGSSAFEIHNPGVVMSSAYGGGAFCVSNDPALGGEASRTRGSNGADVVPVKLRLGRDSQHEGAVLKCVSCQYSQSQQVVLSGATGCPSAWHISYSGFLMSGVSKASTAICVNGDSSLRTESDGSNPAGSVLYGYSKTANCGSNRSCQSHAAGFRIPCVVCLR